MTFAKSAVAAALLMGMTGVAAAAEPVTVYGKLNLTVQNSDEGDAKTEVKSNASRFGVKGAVGLTEDLEAIYQLEWEVNVSDQSAADSSEDNIKARNQFVGLRGNFGEVLVGRNDTLLKQSQGSIDQFNDLEGDIKTLFKGENRMGDSITYKTPMFGLFQAGVSYITEDNSDQRIKDVDQNDRADGYSLALMYGDAGFKKANYFASVAYDDDVKGYDTVRGTLQGKFGPVILGAMYQSGEKSGDSSKDYDGYLVSAAYKWDKATFKVQYQDSDLNEIGGTTYEDAVSAGVDYKLGDSTKVFGFYTKFSAINGEEDADYLGIGLEQKF
ncbi:porin [Gallaecimonas xiamenensis]|uniref:Porin n=1 Tax=Gallaecimonas xiamenensis 3-C-1 TaxID=745411 RepID=K2JI53_9GAMM|nr:porin [Gallaecimonas xiamenensis]EKE74898.1 porin [Gallaecimonas xiamenensis 3-C-1]